MAARQCLFEKFVSGWRVVGDQVGDQMLAGQFGERREPAGLRFIQKRGAVQIQQIEPEGSHRQLLPHAMDIQFASKAPHGDLEGLRPAVGLQAEHFAVQDEIFGRQGAREFHYFRDRGRDVLQTSRIYDHVVARFVDLHARAIHFVFERGFSNAGQRFRNVVGRLGEHGLNGPKQLHVVLC